MSDSRLRVEYKNQGDFGRYKEYVLEPLFFSDRLFHNFKRTFSRSTSREKWLFVANF